MLDILARWAHEHGEPLDVVLELLVCLSGDTATIQEARVEFADSWQTVPLSQLTSPLGMDETNRNKNAARFLASMGAGSYATVLEGIESGQPLGALLEHTSLSYLQGIPRTDVLYFLSEVGVSHLSAGSDSD